MGRRIEYPDLTRMMMLFVMLGMLILPTTKPVVFVWYDSSQSVLNYYVEVQALVFPDILNGGSGQEEAATQMMMMMLIVVVLVVGL